MKKEFAGNANKGGVYQIRNLTNDKIYIGSAKSFKKRANQHESRLNAGKHHNKHLLASWNKHGEDVFLFEILEVVNGSTRERRKREQYFIDQYLNNWEICYNLNRHVNQKVGPWSKNPELTRLKMRMAKLGKVRGPHSKETREKIGKANSKKKRTEKEKNHLRIVMSGRKQPEKVKQKISKTMKEKGLRPPSWKNKKHSIETKLKLSKKVHQMDINDNLIAEFVSISKASQSTKIAISSIVKCCKKQRKTAGGFVWKYAN